MANVGCQGTRAKKEQGHSDMFQKGLPVSHFAAQGLSDPGMAVSKCIINNSLWSSTFRELVLFSLGVL